MFTCSFRQWCLICRKKKERGITKSKIDLDYPGFVNSTVNAWTCKEASKDSSCKRRPRAAPELSTWHRTDLHSMMWSTAIMNQSLHFYMGCQIWIKCNLLLFLSLHLEGSKRDRAVKCALNAWELAAISVQNKQPRSFDSLHMFNVIRFIKGEKHRKTEQQLLANESLEMRCFASTALLASHSSVYISSMTWLSVSWSLDIATP